MVIRFRNVTTAPRKRRVVSGYAFLEGGRPGKTLFDSLSSAKSAYVNSKGIRAKKLIVYVDGSGKYRPVGYVWRSQGAVWYTSFGSGFGSRPAYQIDH